MLYWISRDQRAFDNWALSYAQQVAKEHKVPLTVTFNLYEDFPSASARPFDFMLHGLAETERALLGMNIDFVLLRDANASAAVASLAAKLDAGLIVTDFSPLRIGEKWKEELIQSASGIPVHIVDAHNIVPVWQIPSQETAARTIRKKLWALAPEFLNDSFPEPERHEFGKVDANKQSIDVKALMASLKFRNHVEPTSLTPGFESGMRLLHSFLDKGLQKYAADRNKIMEDAQSNISAYFHFGQISAQRCILEAQKAKKAHSKNKEGADGFIEEAFIRRELSDNFCHYNKLYDSIKGASLWAQETLKVHSSDKREYTYTQEQFENGQTHDKLWNAAQIQMRNTGKMHGFMRMYWAKKTLEWSESPAEALRIVLYLNDLYSLDGRDPNGYVGAMWSVCGVHDMGFKEREITGKIRWMAYSGCIRKFKQAGIDQYIKENQRLKK